MRRKLLLAPVLVALAALAVAVRAGDAPRGSVLAIGGGKLDDAIIEKIVRLSRSDAGRRLVVCPAASGSVDGPEVALFRAHGAKDVAVVDFRSRDEADSPERVKALEGAGGYFFTGGDQNRLLASLRGTRALEVVKAAHRRGALVAGTSAGCAVLGALTILGGEVADISSAAVPIGEGFGLIPAIVDQHFLARTGTTGSSPLSSPARARWASESTRARPCCEKATGRSKWWGAASCRSTSPRRREGAASRFASSRRASASSSASSSRRAASARAPAPRPRRARSPAARRGPWCRRGATP